MHLWVTIASFNSTSKNTATAATIMSTSEEKVGVVSVCCCLVQLLSGSEKIVKHIAHIYKKVNTLYTGNR